MPWRLVIIDNASSDESREIFERFAARHAAFANAAGATITLHLLDQNRGGEAINDALAGVGDGLVHITENDQILQPGWCQHVRMSFRAFPDLGQLSLHAPVPTDDEAWAVKPARAILSDGMLLYQALGNVGNSSVIPARLFADGLRIHNLPTAGTGAFRLPDDTRLSADIVQSGRLVAWSDRYWSRNLGHEAGEITADPDYYDANYSAKPWLGQSGLAARMDEAARRPQPHRASPLFTDAVIQPEMTPGDTEGRVNQLWSMLDGVMPEVEALELLHGLLRALKPRHAVETRTSFGYAAVAMGRALKANGFGHLTTISAEPALGDVARATIDAADSADRITLLYGVPCSNAIDTPIDFLLLDGAPDACEADLAALSPAMTPGATLVCHGAPPPAPANWRSFAVPRGLAIGIHLASAFPHGLS